MGTETWRLGLDPGKTTGFAMFCDTEMVAAGGIEGGFDGFIEWWHAPRGFAPVPNDMDQLIIERYVPLEGFRGIDQTYSLEVQGAARTLAHLVDIQVKLQLRSDKAVLFGQEETGDKGAAERRAWLAERGLIFDPATSHAMDAATHVLVSAKRDPAFWNRYWVGR